MKAICLFKVVLLSLLATVSVAHASISGTVAGTLRFYENEGNYCPTTRSREFGGFK